MYKVNLADAFPYPQFELVDHCYCGDAKQII